ncbi:MAG TPA: DnaJ family domain-containing protein [Dissulfurispiraceae bacterium]|nr:DnaJ family domain-containing protein [Dissulfurispiraceae bacterium]
MDAISKIAEQKIRAAQENGEFDDLPNAGKPMCFEDESFIPEDLRLAYRILKNADCIPPELELRNEILTLRDLVMTLDDDKERLKRMRELNFKITRFNMMRNRPLNLEGFPEYEEKFFLEERPER